MIVACQWNTRIKKDISLLGKIKIDVSRSKLAQNVKPDMWEIHSETQLGK